MRVAVGLHVTPDSVLCAWHGVVTAVPAVVAEHDGVVLHGASALPALDPDAAVDTIDVFRSIDDPSIGIDGASVGTRETVSGLFDDALRRAGAIGGDHDAVVVHPPHWGSLRCAVLSAAARPLARDVVLVSSAVVAWDAASSLRPCTCTSRHRPATGPPASDRPASGLPVRCRTIVLDRTPYRTTVSTVVVSADRPDVVACELVDATVRDMETSDIVAATGAAIADTLAAASACRVVVHGSSAYVSIDDIERAAPIPVIVLDDEDLAAAAVPSAPVADAGRDAYSPPVQPARSGAWLAERTAAASTTRRWGETWWVERRFAMGAAAVAAVVVLGGVAAIVLTNDARPTVDTAARMVDATSTVRVGTTAPPATTTTTTTTDGTTPESAPSLGREFRSAGLTLTVPPGWHVEPGNERVEIRPDVAADMRIVLVARELAAGIDVDGVQATLSTRMGAGGRLSGLERRSDVAEFPALSYVENASDGSTVAWTVVVSPGEQTSVGCQSTTPLQPTVTALCAGIVDSIDLD